MNEPVSRLATAIVLDEDGQKVLLHKREDFRLWEQPGQRIYFSEANPRASIIVDNPY